MKVISKETAKKIASLSRIYLEDHEAEVLAKDLENILHYIEKISALDISQVDPTSHVLPLKNVFHKDIVKPSLTQDEALSIAVEKDKGAFKVPKVIES